MKIAHIEVHGYRLLDKFAMDLRDDLSLVIGKNNTGKTSLLNVLGSYLGASQPRFTYEDFSISLQKRLLESLLTPKSHDPEVPICITLSLVIEYDENDNLRNLSKLMVDLTPEARTVNLRFRTELTADGFGELRADLQASIAAIEGALGESLSDTQMADETQKFVSTNIRRYLIDSIISFDPEDGYELDLSQEPAMIRKVLNLEYVSARRSVENRVSGKGGRTAGRALSQLSHDYYTNHSGGNEGSTPFLQLAAQAAITDRSFTEAYSKVFEEVISKVKRFGVTAGFNADIHIVSSIQPNLLLNDSTLVKYGELEALLPEDHNGLGYLNLIAIIMEIEIRLLRIRAANNSEPSDINILVIEEPEAHTHPQLQYIFIRKIKELLKEHKVSGSLQLQTVITTHSSHITAESDFADIKYFRRLDDRVEARNMTDLEAQYGADKKSYHFLKQYLTLTRAELFFADKAVLIEGDTERLLMQAMMRKVDEEDPSSEAPLSSQNVSVVEVGAHSNIFDHFIEFTGLKTLILTDVDSAKIGQDKDGKPKYEPCAVTEGTHTTNNALKHFFNLQRSAMDEAGDLDRLRSFTSEDKQLEKRDGAWRHASSNSGLFVAYQRSENDYEARSFEDAFISLNRTFIEQNAREFHGLKNRRLFADPSKKPYELASSCIAKKTHFALDLIYAEADGSSTWLVPEYIAEGLRWLKDA